MTDDIVDIAIPANTQGPAETLGLTVTRSVADGARVRRVSRDDAEIVIACLHDYGFVARIVEPSPPSGSIRATHTPKPL
jgi:hypothetical protein